MGQDREREMKQEFLNGQIILHNTDCVDVMREIGEKEIDFSCWDLPYGINYQYNTYLDNENNLIKLINNISPYIKKINKRACLFVGITNLMKYPQYDWLLSYSYNTTANFGKLGYNQWQPILFYGEDVKGFGNVNNILKSDTIKFSGGSDTGFLNKVPKFHPCQKPIKVISYLINRFSFENDLIFDGFAGSGTTAIACIRTKRRFIGCELDKEYFEKACERINTELKQLTLF